jgi:MoCo/4Fe-4S cofactor protein with predicted Tat translocation signal
MDSKKHLDISSYILKDGDKELNSVEASQETSQEVKGEKDSNYWRSFGELYSDPAFLDAKKHEFSVEAETAPEVSKMSGVSRRKFLALMSASAALAAAGCSNFRDKGEIVPYNKQPEGVIIGEPNYFASTFTYNGQDYGTLVKTREGRPIKLDGNPDHPVTKGKTTAKLQASILNLYDPDRIKNPQYSGDRKEFKDVTWEEVDTNLINEMKAAAGSGKEIAIISDSIISPTQKKLLSDFQKAYPTAKVYVHELFNDNVKDAAFEKCYGVKKYPLIKWNEANIIVALENDFLLTSGNVSETARLYAERRDVMTGADFNRLYVVEGDMSLTGMNSDYRLRLRTDAIEEFVMNLAAELSRRGVQMSANLGGFNLDDFASRYMLNKESLNQLVSDLLANRGKSIISAGSALPESTQIAVNMLNDALGNTALYSFENITEGATSAPAPTTTAGETQTETTAPVTTTTGSTFDVLSSRADFDGLMSRMESGNVGVVIHYGTNPVFTIPADYNYGETLSKVPTVVTMTEIANDSSAVSSYVLPVNHFLESWGDFQTRASFYSLQQPVISPLYNTRQKEAVLLNWLSGSPNEYNHNIYHLYLKDNWQKSIFPSLNLAVGFTNFWAASLHDGAVLTKKTASQSLTFNSSAIGSAGKMEAGSDIVVLLKESETVGDGRYANNGWLQELPGAVSKITWDNYAAISPDTAKGQNLASYDVIKVTIDGRTQNVPVFVQPGIADGQIVIELGYGQTTAGTVGSGTGTNANVLVGKAPALTYWLYNNAKIEKTGDTYELASTVEHYPIDDPKYKDIQFKRDIIQEGTVKQYRANPAFLEEKTAHLTEQNEYPTISGQEFEYTGVKWAMAIDLNRCIGCGECVMACNVENNIPVVGKEQVIKNREMMWLRVDRYYSGTPQDPRSTFQLMLCQQCDFAPCENVCPVKATVHSDDGLNGMAYNRCVGTRYCANNCPYKVRRFNYFNFRMMFKDGYQTEEPLNQMSNPEVTVRSRGVMEKCTFCVQRIMHARQIATQEGREIKGTDVTTACQDACGTDAIVFGDMNDKSSKLNEYREHKLGYNVLDQLKVRPNITYIAKLRNTEEEITEVEHH